MYRTTLLLMLGTLAGAATTRGATIQQLNPALGTTPGDHWLYDSDNNIITLKTASTSETYVFWSHEIGDPDTLAPIAIITRAQTLTSGTVKVQISKSLSSLVPGATNIGRISFDTQDITSIIEGIEITGDLFTSAASAVDHVTGPIEVGGALLNAMTVLEDLEGAVSIADFTTVGADIEIVGDALEPIAVGTYIPNRTASSDDSVFAVAA